LVVEDEAYIRFFLKETLERVGHEVSEAASGEQALEILRETTFDVAILDVVLGGQVDGHGVLEAIRARSPETATVMITAHGSLDSAVQALREGVDDYVLKPVRASEVRRAVDEALARRGASDRS
jgi:DNA-binding NtrC family response regulator